MQQENYNPSPSPSGWPWPLDGIQRAMEGLFNWVVDALSGWFGFFWEYVIKPGIDSLLSGLGWIAQKVWDVAGWLVDQITAFIDWTIGKLTAIWDTLVGVARRVVDLFGWIWDKLVEFGELVWRELSKLGGWIWNKVSGAFRDLISWLGQQIGGIIEGVSDLIRTVFGELINVIGGFLATIGEAIARALSIFLEWILNAIAWIAEKIIGLIRFVAERVGGLLAGFIRYVFDMMTDLFAPGSPKGEVALAADIMVHQMYETLEQDIITAYESPASPEAVAATAVATAGKIAGIQATAEGIAEAADVTHPAKKLGVSDTLRSILRTLGTATISSMPILIMYESGIFTPLRYHFHSMFTPVIPPDRELIEGVVRRILSYERFVEEMRKHGFSEEWANMLLDKAWYVPPFGEAREMFWRGEITHEQLAESLKYRAIREDWVARYDALIPRIPGPADLIRFVVREVIPPETFTVYMRQQGYFDPFPGHFWDAHWVLPPPERVWMAFLRGVLSEGEVRKYYVWHDYKPDPRPGIRATDIDIIVETQWDLPGKRDQRWMYEWGIIGPDEMRGLLHLANVHPQWQDKVLRAWIANLMREEIMGLVREAQRDRADEYITDDEFRERLREIWLPDDRIEYYLQKAISMAEREEREEEAKIFIEGFRVGVLTDEELKAELMGLGMSEARADRIVKREILRKIRRRVTKGSKEKES